MSRNTWLARPATPDRHGTDAVQVMTDPVPLLLDRLEGVRPSGPGWVARCPGHEDRHASLSVAAGDDGRALLTCHAGCTIEVVVGALGLTMADLYPRTNGATGPARPARGRGREIRYRARLADGSHADERIEHVRLDRPDGTKRMWWERDGRKGLGGLSPSVFVLYGTERLDLAGMDAVVVVEGEKATDALASWGVVAVLAMPSLPVASSTMATSVNVPPISTPIRHICSFRHLMQVPRRLPPRHRCHYSNVRSI